MIFDCDRVTDTEVAAARRDLLTLLREHGPQRSALNVLMALPKHREIAVRCAVWELMNEHLICLRRDRRLGLTPEEDEWSARPGPTTSS